VRSLAPVLALRFMVEHAPRVGYVTAVFYRDDDVFETLLEGRRAFEGLTGPRLAAGGHDPSAVLGRVLDDFERRLEAARSRPSQHVFVESIPLVGADERVIERAKALYRLLAVASVGSKSSVERSLLATIAPSRDRDAPAFWREVLELSRVKGTLARTRRRFALAALGYRALHHAERPSLEALLEACRDAAAAVREDAVDVLGRLARTLRDPEWAAEADGVPGLLAAAVTELGRAAVADVAFGPRFLARRGLVGAGEAPPLDWPEGAFTFRFRGPKRVFERTLASTDTLFALHAQVIRALGLEDDHLFAFHLSNDVRDRRFMLPPLEDWGGDFDVSTRESVGESATGAGVAEPCPFAAEDAGFDDFYRLGELGLAAKHALLLRHDFGDDHRIRLEVVAAHERAADVRPEARTKKPAPKREAAKK